MWSNRPGTVRQVVNHVKTKTMLGRLDYFKGNQHGGHQQHQETQMRPHINERMTHGCVTVST